MKVLSLHVFYVKFILSAVVVSPFYFSFWSIRIPFRNNLKREIIEIESSLKIADEKI
jgi:hypothetical protein